MHRVAEEACQAPERWRAEAEAEAALSRGIIELMVFVEDYAEILFCDPDTGIPNFDAQHPVAPAAAQKYFTALRVFQRVRQQVAEHLLEQRWGRCRPKGRTPPRAREASALWHGT